MSTIDLNCDLGERDDLAASDEALLGIVTSANIACGGHAGDQASMTRTVRMALAKGVAIGAHPSFPDRAGFGRVELEMSVQDLAASIAGQVRLLSRIAEREGGTLSHVKPHGALYHAAMNRPEVARAVTAGVREATANRPRLVLIGLAGSATIDLWNRMGMAAIGEAFADRAYEADGSLRSRRLERSVIDDPSIAASQARRIASEGVVVAADGSVVRMLARTICIHSDTPGAVDIARAVRSAIESAGVRIAATGTDAE